ncbi:MAG: hypothetical protein ABFC24_12820, partial [Methanoregulaceae archaeon]
VRAVICILLLAAICAICQAGNGTWSNGTGLFATGLGDRVIYTLSVSSDGNTIYSGTGSSSVFSYTCGFTAPATATETSAVSSGSGSGSSGSSQSGGTTTSNARFSHSLNDMTDDGGSGDAGLASDAILESTGSEGGDGTGNSGTGSGTPARMGFLSNRIVFIGIGCGALMGGFLVRRWWIRRNRFDPLGEK